MEIGIFRDNMVHMMDVVARVPWLDKLHVPDQIGVLCIILEWYFLPCFIWNAVNF